MKLPKIAYLVQSIVRISNATLVMEHARGDVRLEVPDVSVMNNVQTVVSNATSLMLQIANLVIVNLMVTVVNIAVAKIANHQMEFVNV